MDKNVEALTARVELLQRTLEAYGIRPAPEPAPMTERADYIPHGSTRHATFLGLVEVGKDDQAVSLVTFTSSRTGRTFRLEDEIGAIRHYPGIDPKQAALLVLQQKVNSLEMPVEVPQDAPPMFEPAAIYPT